MEYKHIRTISRPDTPHPESPAGTHSFVKRSSFAADLEAALVDIIPPQPFVTSSLTSSASGTFAQLARAAELRAARARIFHNSHSQISLGPPAKAVLTLKMPRKKKWAPLDLSTSSENDAEASQDQMATGIVDGASAADTNVEEELLQATSQLTIDPTQTIHEEHYPSKLFGSKSTTTLQPHDLAEYPAELGARIAEEMPSTLGKHPLPKVEDILSSIQPVPIMKPMNATVEDEAHMQELERTQKAQMFDLHNKILEIELKKRGATLAETEAKRQAASNYYGGGYGQFNHINQYHEQQHVHPSHYHGYQSYINAPQYPGGVQEHFAPDIAQSGAGFFRNYPAVRGTPSAIDTSTRVSLRGEAASYYPKQNLQQQQNLFSASQLQGKQNPFSASQGQTLQNPYSTSQFHHQANPLSSLKLQGKQNPLSAPQGQNLHNSTMHYLYEENPFSMAKLKGVKSALRVANPKDAPNPFSTSQDNGLQVPYSNPQNHGQQGHLPRSTSEHQREMMYLSLKKMMDEDNRQGLKPDGNSTVTDTGVDSVPSLHTRLPLPEKTPSLGKDGTAPPLPLSSSSYFANNNGGPNLRTGLWQPEKGSGFTKVWDEEPEPTEEEKRAAMLEDVNEWWTRDARIPSHDINKLQEMKAQEKGKGKMTEKMAAAEPMDDLNSKRKDPWEPYNNTESVGDLLFPAIQNMATYKDNKTDLCSWTKAPSWAIDHSAEGNNSFFSEKWGQPPQRVGRDPRYRATQYDGRTSVFEDPNGRMPREEFSHDRGRWNGNFP